MRTAVLLTVAAAALAAGFAPAPFPKSGRKSEDNSPAALTGKWEFVVWERNAAKSEASQYLDITPEKVDFVPLRDGGKVTYKFIFRPELTPRGFQWKPDWGDGWFGSYRVQGDTLTLIFKTGGAFADRPTDFDGRPEYRFVLKRMR